MRNYEFTAREGDRIVNKGTCTSIYNLRAVAVLVFKHTFGRHPTGGSFGLTKAHGEAWDKYRFRGTILNPKNHKQVTVYQIHYGAPARRGLLIPERAQSLVEKSKVQKIEVNPVVYALLTEFLIRVSTSECEVWPGNATCLTAHGAELERQSGMTEPCWPCQARAVNAQIDCAEQAPSPRKASTRQGRPK